MHYLCATSFNTLYYEILILPKHTYRLQKELMGENSLTAAIIHLTAYPEASYNWKQ